MCVCVCVCVATSNATLHLLNLVLPLLLSSLTVINDPQLSGTLLTMFSLLFFFFLLLSTHRSVGLCGV